MYNWLIIVFVSAFAALCFAIVAGVVRARTKPEFKCPERFYVVTTILLTISLLVILSSMVITVVSCTMADNKITSLEQESSLQGQIAYYEQNYLDCGELHVRAMDYNLKLMRLKEELNTEGNWTPLVIYKNRINNLYYIQYKGEQQ